MASPVILVLFLLFSPVALSLVVPCPGRFICYHCKESVHIHIRCPKKQVCNYCKVVGHLIGDYSIFARLNRQKGGGGQRPSSSSAGHGPAAPAYATTLAPSDDPGDTTSSSSSATSISQEDIRRLVREAIQESLHTTLIATFFMGMPSHSQWHLDYATVNHMTIDRYAFETLQPSSSISLQVANGSNISVDGVGSMHSRRLSLPRAYYVPQLAPNLVSVGQLADGGCHITFDVHGCTMKDIRPRAEIGRGCKRGRVYMLESYLRGDVNRGGTPRGTALGDGSVMGIFKRAVGGAPGVPQPDSSISSLCGSYSGYSVKLLDWDLWYFRLGHPNKSKLFETFKNN
ncbi:unnamed protein product [Linum trigynum]|uniref:Retrovirus-related Pol polyprotein from transposon TNT 1-94-like beta-barrel domain-containing protein n=1 Tax=Linum trigynum TaxID=586398 RepID=A0AAV2ECA8_9ROSI